MSAILSPVSLYLKQDLPTKTYAVFVIHLAKVTVVCAPSLEHDNDAGFPAPYAHPLEGTFMLRTLFRHFYYVTVVLLSPLLTNAQVLVLVPEVTRIGNPNPATNAAFGSSVAGIGDA